MQNNVSCPLCAWWCGWQEQRGMGVFAGGDGGAESQFKMSQVAQNKKNKKYLQ